MLLLQVQLSQPTNTMQKTFWFVTWSNAAALGGAALDHAEPAQRPILSALNAALAEDHGIMYSCKMVVMVAQGGRPQNQVASLEAGQAFLTTSSKDQAAVACATRPLQRLQVCSGCSWLKIGQQKMACAAVSSSDSGREAERVSRRLETETGWRQR